MHHTTFTVILTALLMLCGCDKKSSSSSGQSQNRQFDVKGIVRAIGIAEKEVTIEHEDIPEYMPSMTMPFAVKNMKDVEGLSVGDGVQFQYVVTPNDSWVANIRKIDAKVVKLPQPEPEAPKGEGTKDAGANPPVPPVPSAR